MGLGLSIKLNYFVLVKISLEFSLAGLFLFLSLCVCLNIYIFFFLNIYFFKIMSVVQNMELENRRRRSAQARVPSDPNAWQQMRENYEAIILEDHAFTEQHNIEYALWQLHYKRIEELRAHFSAALASAGSNTSQGVKGPARPDRVTKIRLQFKTFLSEATGFYHDLILKIRAKYGLPLGYFSEDTENQIVTEKDGKKSAEMKKGLISCHRCLIYLGDLARYKGLYGEGDSKSREFTAASSYYLEAASLWPSSGNPHHQVFLFISMLSQSILCILSYIVILIFHCDKFSDYYLSLLYWLLILGMSWWLFIVISGVWQ